MNRLHGYSTIPTPLGENTPEQNELRKAIGLDKPMWVQIMMAMVTAAVGAYTTHAIFQWANKGKRRSKGRR